jgi:hypothetical protein
MAPEINQTNAELANVLEDHANMLIDGGKRDHGMEPFLRVAAERLRRTDESVPLGLRVVAELRRIADHSYDIEMKRSLRTLMGEAQ